MPMAYMNSIAATEGQSVTLTANTFTRTGYIFRLGKYYTAATATYADEASYTMGSERNSACSLAVNVDNLAHQAT